jgi:pyruvate-formate lyase-activating enzyme
MRVLLVSANREKLPSPVVPLGILAVAAALREPLPGRPDHDVSVADLCFEQDPLAALRRAVRDDHPDVVGIGIRNLHTNAYDGSEELLAEYAAVVRAVREETAVPVVLGGSGFSLRPQTLLAELGGDHGVVGEGERVLRDLLDTLQSGDTPPRIVSSAVAAREAAAPLTKLRPRPIASDLDLLPLPARDLVDPRYYAHDGTEAIQTKRGCAFQCAYCDYPDLEGRKVRVRDPEAIADEVCERAARPDVTHVFFVDSVFNVPRAHALAVCRALVARGSPVPWVCYGSPASFDDELVAAMAEARCAGVEIGTDTGTEAMLKKLRKPFTLREVLETRALFVKHGILDAHTFVVGAEGETAAEVRDTLDFVDRLDPDVAVFVAFLEDREQRRVHRAPDRAQILALLAEEAPKRPGWIVPELSIRFGPRVARLAERSGWKGPSWLRLAARRRGSPGAGT